MNKHLELPTIALQDRTPVVDQLINIINELKKQIDGLKEEVARLKKHKGKPKLKPSNLREPKQKNRKKKTDQQEEATQKSTTKPDRVEIIKVDNLPENVRFKGYRDYRIQELVFCKETILYRLERWQLPDGSYVVGSLPAGISSGHFGLTLQAYVLHQYHHQGVTQPLLLNQLKELKFELSSGQLNNLLIEKKASFHKEKEGLLPAALSVSNYIHVDDTGARHDGKNGYCTHIGNELFAWFESTASKSRRNFLALLRCGYEDYILKEESFAYMRRQKLAPYIRTKLAACGQRIFTNEASWQALLKQLEITSERHIRIVTEAALIGSVLHHGFQMNTVIMSDDAGQFNIFRHVLCWIHVERNIHKLMPVGQKQLEATESIRSEIWELYQQLKSYKKDPMEQEKKEIEKAFDKLCGQRTCFQLLNNQLKRIKMSKHEMLLVLERPELPLHNNLSEGDIREYVKRRKISGSTRSEEGRKCRDTFASLKKTAVKLKVGFWDYLLDRISGKKEITWLPDLVTQLAIAKTAPLF